MVAAESLESRDGVWIKGALIGYAIARVLALWQNISGIGCWVGNILPINDKEGLVTSHLGLGVGLQYLCVYFSVDKMYDNTCLIPNR